MKKHVFLSLLFAVLVPLCAQNLSQQTPEITLSPNAELVISSKKLLDSSFTKENAQKVLKDLLPIENDLDDSQVKNINDIYYSLLVDCCSLADDWKSIPQYYSRILQPKTHSTYLAASAYYKVKEYTVAEKLLEESAAAFKAQKEYDLNSVLLYAQILSRRGKYKASSDLYAELSKKNLLDSKNRLEYAKTLYYQKKYEEASAQAAASKLSEADYLCGICNFQLKQYEQARDFFKVYSVKNKDSSMAVYSDYYMAVCLYKLSSYKDAVPVFEKTADSKKAPELVYKAYEYAAKSSVLSGDINYASRISEKLVKAAANQTEKEAAVIFSAELYADSANYKKALSLIEPYIKDKTEFSVKCLFLKANLLAKSGDKDNAAIAYEKLYRDFPDSAYSDEAMFRQAELFYMQNDLVKAESVFSKYMYDFPSGKFADSALFFSAECNLKNGQLDRSIMQNKSLLSKYPKSTYAYNAGKNLMDAYYAQKDFSASLETARYLVKNFRVQSASDGIGKKINELEQIVQGTDSHIVEKQTEYKEKGELSTKEGRIAGTELVELYVKYGTREQALNLALSLLNAQTSKDELAYAAKNAEFCASYYEKYGETKKAADYYLKAAENYRAVNNSQKAAASLYSAADCFVASSMKADAKETANLLIQLYPDSKQAKRVMDLLK